MPGQPTQDASNYLALTKLHEPLVNNMFSGRAARGARREQETRVITTRWPSGRKPIEIVGYPEGVTRITDRNIGSE